MKSVKGLTHDRVSPFSVDGAVLVLLRGWDLGQVLVLGIFHLLALDFCDVDPRFPEAVGAAGQIVLDPSVQTGEAVTGYGRVHMVFDVEVHMPVEELDDRVQVNRTAGEPEVGHLVGQAYVLGGVAHRLKPLSEGLRKREDEEQDPVA